LEVFNLEVSAVKKIKGFIKLLRPKQWIKNSFVLAALLFAVKFFDPTYLTKALWATLSFCMISSVIYVFNDIIDMEKDRHHPKKKFRPIAAGIVTRLEAVFIIIIMLPLSILIGLKLGLPFLATILLYVINNILYTFYIKHVVILDVMSIAGGFILRVAGGALAINVMISPWILLCTLLLSLFLGFSKRRHEIITLEEDAQKHRKILDEYSVDFIDNMLSIVTATVVMSYSLYTFNKNIYLMITIPFVLYGIFRYQYVVYKKMEGGSPEETVVSDKPLLIDILMWIFSSLLIMYVTR
jgi:4-hydroxybenzoate polyprenyltransferase